MKDLFDLTGRTAVVTGASSGLGAEAAIAYAQAGADVALLDIKVDGLSQLKTEIEEIGRKTLAVECDVTQEESVKTAVQKIMDVFGKIDILLNNAGVAVPGSVEDMTEEEWDKSFNTNVKGIFLISKYIIPQMKEKKYGKIVNIASVNAIVADKENKFIRHSYNASKSAVIGLTKGMACSYAKYGITVNAIGPGLFKTKMTTALFESEKFLNEYNEMNPTGRPGKKDELNGTVLYFSSDASSYVQGQFVIVDGGGVIV